MIGSWRVWWENKKPDSEESGSAVDGIFAMRRRPLRAKRALPSKPSRWFPPSAFTGGLNGSRENVAQIDGTDHERVDE
jgi:hypothetical protein